MTQGGGKGKVTFAERRLQSFLYLLLRDYLPSGDVEELFETLGDSEHYPSDVVYSCPHIAGLSGDMARRLLGTRSEMSDNEEGQHEDRTETKKESSRPEASVKDLSDKEREAFRKLDEALEDFRAKATQEIFSGRPSGQGVYYESFQQPKGKDTKVHATGEDLEALRDLEDLEDLEAKEEDGGFLNSSGFPVTEEEIRKYAEDYVALRIKDDDAEGHVFNAKGYDQYGYDREGVLKKDCENLEGEGKGSDSSGSTASESATKTEGETES